MTALGKSVIAPGGGAVLDERNAALLKKEGILIWLVADEKTTMERMLADAASASQRPRFSSRKLREEIRETLSVRALNNCRFCHFDRREKSLTVHNL